MNSTYATENLPTGTTVRYTGRLSEFYGRTGRIIFTATGRMVAPCAGANHKDKALIGRCDGCGCEVAKTDSGRILDIRTTENGARVTACWSSGHECDPERAAAHAAYRATQIDAGEIIKGQTVTVIKGRKVAKGTTGIVFWVGEDSYGKGRIGFKGDDGETYWTATSNVEVTA